MKYKSRYLTEQIKKLNQSFKILYLGGARQVGKTTLLQELANELNYNYITLDNFNNRQLANTDPALFLDQHPQPLIIDEVQYAPNLFLELKQRVDQSNQKGQYWLTGSQPFQLLKNINESLVGRVGILKLEGYTLGELLETPISQTINPQNLTKNKAKLTDLVTLQKYIFTGFYPQLHNQDSPPREAFYNSYINTYLSRDLRELYGVKKTLDFNTFIQLLAARTSQQLNYSQLAKDANISVNATREWINILQASGHIILLQPYYKNISKRLIKSPKIYFTDTGLATYLTKWSSPETLFAGNMAGAIFETFIVNEVRKNYLYRGIEPNLYYLRDKEGHEIDLILEQDGKIFPFEIKMAHNINSKHYKNISYYRQKITNLDLATIYCLAKKPQKINQVTQIIPASCIT